MADNTEEDDEFEKLLDSFINNNFDEEESDPVPEEEQTPEEKKAMLEAAKSTISSQNENKEEDDDYIVLEGEENNVPTLSEEGQQIYGEIVEDMDGALINSLSEAKEEYQNQQMEEEKKLQLGSDEAELAQAFVNFYTSVNNLCTQNLGILFEHSFDIDDLYPNYRPSLGAILSNDLVNGWLLLVRMFPEEIGKFPPSSSDEEFLNFAEKLTNQDLQLAVISYVEILIDIESCELSYQAKLIRYQEKHIKRIMYEEYMARKERQRKFTEAVKKKNFPIDAEKLISNYFRVSQKDVDGAFKALTTNPAVFAPIDFSKIKPRFFGLVKVSPKDGIRINLEIGNFLKKLKV